MQRFLDTGGTLVLATHNLYLAEKLCRRTMWLERGVVRQCGETHDVTRGYRDSMSTQRTRAAAAMDDGAAHDDAAGPAAVLSVRGAPEAPKNVVTTGGPWRIDVAGIEPDRAARIDLRRIDGTLVARLDVGGALHVDLPACPLLPGRFVVELCQRGTNGGEVVRYRCELLVRGARRELGNVVLEHGWE
jgi:hypothetical protein